MRLSLTPTFGVRNDNQIFYDFFDKFYSNVFFPFVKDQGITQIIHLGDIVDRRKFINYITLKKFNDIFIDPIKNSNLKLDVIIGNHDIPYRNTNKINAMSELFGKDYEQYGIFYFDEPLTRTYDGTAIDYIPWINRENYDNTLDFMKRSSSQVLFGHLELNGFEMHRGMPNHHGMSIEPFKKYELVCSGHFHHKSRKGNIQYLGNPYELTWNDYGDERGFHVFDTDTRELTFIPNPYKLFHKVWYDDSDKEIEDFTKIDLSRYAGTFVKVIVQNKNNPYWFDLFMDRLYKVSPANVKIVEDNKGMDLQTEEEIMDEAEDTLTTLHKAVDSLNTKVDKSELSRLFSSLYTEASQLET